MPEQQADLTARTTREVRDRFSARQYAEAEENPVIVKTEQMQRSDDATQFFLQITVTPPSFSGSAKFQADCLATRGKSPPPKYNNSQPAQPAQGRHSVY